MKYLFGFFAIICAFIGMILVIVLVSDMAEDRRQEAMLSHERIVAQRQQYDQERWQLTLAAVNNLSKSGIIAEISGLIVTVILAYVILKGKVDINDDRWQ